MYRRERAGAAASRMATRTDVQDDLSVMGQKSRLAARLHGCTYRRCTAKSETHAGIRTPNLTLRRGTPYPLGHAGLMPVAVVLQPSVYIPPTWRSFVSKSLLPRAMFLFGAASLVGALDSC